MKVDRVTIPSEYDVRVLLTRAEVEAILENLEPLQTTGTTLILEVLLEDLLVDLWLEVTDHL